MSLVGQVDRLTRNLEATDSLIANLQKRIADIAAAQIALEAAWEDFYQANLYESDISQLSRFSELKAAIEKAVEA